MEKTRLSARKRGSVQRAGRSRVGDLGIALGLPARLARCLTLSAALAAMCLAAEAGSKWQALATPADIKRLTEMDQTRASAVREAERGDEFSDDFDEIRSLVSAPSRAGPLPDLAGSWLCRTIKLGGEFGALTIYDFFNCRIRRDSEALRLEKLTGSQRLSGRLFESDLGGLVYLGSVTVGDESPIDYGANTDRDQIGLLRVLAPDHLVLELPKPRLESNHDILELKR